MEGSPHNGTEYQAQEEIGLALYDLDRKAKQPSPLEAMEAARFWRRITFWSVATR